MSLIYPTLVKIRQNFPRPVVKDAPATMAAEMKKLLTAAGVTPGQKVGITGGSRGIQNQIPMLQGAIAAVREFGAIPVILAAMGSHGGGSAKGQFEMLTSLGITKENLGVEILTCDVGRELGLTQSGLQAYILEHAFTVDHIVPINRVKIHTSFHGGLESGCIKKLVVGLGGPPGARQFHSIGKLSELSKVLEEIGTLIIEKMPIAGGIALIENAFEETAVIQAMLPETMIQEEKKLLEYSRSLMPSLPVDDMHGLIIEEMGKNYSGTGMDPNILGRLLVQGDPEPEKPAIRYLSVLDLSEASHGNATGIGYADFTTKKLVDKIDRKATYLNCLTSTFPKRARIPMYFDTEQDLVEAMLTCLSGNVAPEDLRLIIVPNTLFLTDMYVSRAIYEELRGRDTIETLGDPVLLSFENGMLQPRVSGHAH